MTCNGDPTALSADCTGCWDYTYYELLGDAVPVASRLFGGGDNPDGFTDFAMDVCDPTLSIAQLKVTIQNDADDNSEVQRFDNVTLVCFEKDELEIVGQQTVCDVSAPILYSVDPNPAGQSYVWSVSPMGPTVGANTGALFGVDWSTAAIGTYTVSVDVTDPFGCPETITTTVFLTEDVPTPITCNGLVNITLDDNCSLDFLVADMFLEGMQFANDGYTVSTYDLNDSSIDPSLDPSAYIGMEIGVQVTALCGGNSCWGRARIDDKSIPPLECAPSVIVDCEDIDVDLGFPTNIGSFAANPDGTFTLFGYDNCGDATLSFLDMVVESNCSDPDFSSVIERTWTVQDANGGFSTCVTTINVNRSDLSDITFPDNFDPAFGTDALEPQSCASWPTLPNGHPDPSFTGSPQGAFCLDVEISFNDQRFDGCNDQNFKILRTWTVVDVCSNPHMIITHVQNIVVADNQPPIINCPRDAVASEGLNEDVAASIGTNDNYNCTADWPVEPPIIIFECSDFTWTVGYKLADENGQAPAGTVFIDDDITGTFPNFVINDLPLGRTWLQYIVTDACGFSMECNTELFVFDDSPPQAVCDLQSNIALNSDGCAYANTSTFDDGSFSCGDVELGIRRAGSGAYGEQIKFTCADANSTVLVELQATSANGETSVCVVEAFIQEPSTSSFTTPPNMTVTVDCDDINLNNLDAQYGSATVTTNLCGLGSIVEQGPSLDLDDCGNGTLTRRWRYTNQAGNQTTATQVITIRLGDPFDGDIVWPSDVELDGCRNTQVPPESLPTGSQFPSFNANDCSDVLVNYEDIPFYFIEGACVKILRNWTVIDWCTASQIPGGGIWEFSQVIIINDNQAPVITSGCNLPAIMSGEASGCNEILSFNATATDNCPEDLSWTFTVNGSNRNVMISNGQASVSNVVLGAGSHTVCWTVSDACGNIDECCDTFSIVDTHPPTAACVSVLTTVITNPNGSTVIWANDFNASSFDNCNASAQLDYAFSLNPLDQSLEVSCSDITNGVVDSISVDIFVFDASGNYSTCPATLVVQDNSDFCPDVNTGTRIAIAGNIQTETFEMVDEVMMTIEADDITGFPFEYMAYDGIYAFPDLDMYTDYSISAEKTDGVMNGVSTLDLVLIQKHLLGVQELDSPYKIIAADANDSGSLSAIDLVELRKLILGIYTEFPNNDSWRFVDAKQVFADASNPFPFMESIHHNDTDQNMMDADFIAVKIGDVNESVHLNNVTAEVSNRTDNMLALDLATAKVSDKQIRYDLSLTDSEELIGMQFTIEYDAASMSMSELSSDYLNLSEANYSVIQEGKLTFSWSEIDAISVDASNPVLSLVFDTNNAHNDISISSAITNAEAYTMDDSTIVTKGIELNKEEDDFVLHQNSPNPFKTETVIQFQLPQASKATISIFDASGKIFFAKTDDYSKGLNEVIIDGNHLPYSGILYYQLNSYTHTATKKLIVLK
jgi:hypothetical protein